MHELPLCSRVTHRRERIRSEYMKRGLSSHSRALVHIQGRTDLEVQYSPRLEKVPFENVMIVLILPNGRSTCTDKHWYNNSLPYHNFLFHSNHHLLVFQIHHAIPPTALQSTTTLASPNHAYSSFTRTLYRGTKRTLHTTALSLNMLVFFLGSHISAAPMGIIIRRDFWSATFLFN